MHADQELHLVVPPIKPADRRRPALALADWHALADLSDGMIVMTYDFSHPQQPGPNAPLPWMRSNLDALLPEDDERSL